MTQKLDFGIVSLISGPQNFKQHNRELQFLIESLKENGITEIYSSHLNFPGRSKELKNRFKLDHVDLLYRGKGAFVACEIRTVKQTTEFRMP